MHIVEESLSMYALKNIMVFKKFIVWLTYKVPVCSTYLFN